MNQQYRKNGVRNAIKVRIKTMHLSNQLHNGKGGLCFQLRFTRYTVLQMKNSLRNVSEINPVATEMLANTATQMPHHTIMNQKFALLVKRTGTQRRTKTSP